MRLDSQQVWRKVVHWLAVISPCTWGLLWVFTLVGAILIGWISYPYIFEKPAEKNAINLPKEQESKWWWDQLQDTNFNVFLFNITNPSEVMRGAKPIVQEVGPYCYREVKDKLDVHEDSATDTISYTARSVWYENQQDGNCEAPELTGQELLVVPNVPLLSILILAEKDFPPPVLTLVNLALPNLFGNFSDVFLRAPARRLLFDGFLIDCSDPTILTRPVCDIVTNHSKALKKLGNDQYSYSFFGAKNGTPEEFRYTVRRGTQDVRDVGRVVALDGRPELPFWRGECNKLLGTDATISDNGSLTVYYSEICRLISLVYEGQYDDFGKTGYAYSATLGDAETNPADRCYCSADDCCYKKGVLDALKCQGAPLASSLPHFYQGSQDYVNGVVGLRPDKEKHGIFVVIDPISGVSLLSKKRIQMNLDLKPIRFIPITQGLRHTLTPLFWAEELSRPQIEVSGSSSGPLVASLHRPARSVDVIKWVCVAAGGTLILTAIGVKVRWTTRDRVQVLGGDAAGEHSCDEEYKEAVKYLEAERTTSMNCKDPFFIGVTNTGPGNTEVLTTVLNRNESKMSSKRDTKH